MFDFDDLLIKQANKLKIDRSFLDRYINVGFSGGEKKKSEILQLNVLKPKLAVLDETDSGLDIDALKIVSDGIKSFINPRVGVLLIIYYQRVLDQIKPDFVHVFVDGKIVKTGGMKIAAELESKGYESLTV